MAVSLRLRRGLIANLPAEAGDGELMAARDAGQIYMGQGAGQPLLPLPLFGSEYAYDERTTSQDITANTATDYLTMPVDGLPAGIYRLDAHALWANSNASSGSHIELLVDGAALLPGHPAARPSGADENNSTQLSRDLSLTAGSHLIKLQCWRENVVLANPMLTVKFGCIRLMRVG